jgi:hypothetical protein
MECRTTLNLALLYKTERKKGRREISEAEDYRDAPTRATTGERREERGENIQFNTLPTPASLYKPDTNNI